MSKQEKKAKSFSKLSNEEKLDRLYSLLCSESAVAKSRHDENTKSFEEVKENIKCLEKRVDRMEKYSDTVNEEIHRLKLTVNNLQQSAYCNELIIHGVPETEKNDDDLLTTVQLILQQVQCLPAPVIRAVKRFGKENQADKRNRPILLQLNHYSEKEALLAKKKGVKVTCDKIIVNGKALGTSNESIFFDERLTQHTADLFRNARTLRKQQKLKFVWIRNGKLYIRKKDGDKANCINCQEQLDKIARLNKRKYNSTPIDIDDRSEMSDTDDDSEDELSEERISPERKKTRNGKEYDRNKK